MEEKLYYVYYRAVGMDLDWLDCFNKFLGYWEEPPQMTESLETWIEINNIDIPPALWDVECPEVCGELIAISIQHLYQKK